LHTDFQYWRGSGPAQPICYRSRVPLLRVTVMTTPVPEDLTETRLDGESVYRGVLLHILRDRVRLPDGKEAVREYVNHPGAAVILPLFQNGDTLIERQYRYPLRQEIFELPAGKFDPGEDGLTTAKRELKEETGYVAREWRHLGTIHPLAAYCNERIEMFLALELEHQGRALDDGEHLEVMRMPVAEALDWVRRGRITDSKTMIGLFWAEKLLSGAWK
jgi:ADP-ribose pyrophosphatase